MNLPQSDGCSLRQHFENVERQTGVRDPKLDAVEVPEEVEYLWSWFWEIRAGIGSAGFGPTPISHTELRAWMENTRVTLCPWEQTAIRAMDQEYLGVHANKNRKEQEKQKQKAMATRAKSTAAPRRRR